MVWRLVLQSIGQRSKYGALGVLMVLVGMSLSMPGVADQKTALLNELPEHITRLTTFGQRADWSHDGKRILFIEKTYGDVFEVEVATKIVRPMTHHYFHEGYTRALYLSNGDILLSGSRTFDAEDPHPSRRASAELWVLDKSLTKAPVSLGTRCSEGPAVSRTQMRIAWVVNHDNYPEQIEEGESQMWLADFGNEDGIWFLEGKRLILDSQDVPFALDMEAQNFRPPAEKEIIFSAYALWGGEVMGVNIETGHMEVYSRGFRSYDEAEGIFPDGEFTCVERVTRRLEALEGLPRLDIWKLKLDSAGTVHAPRERTWEQLTYFSEYGDYRGTNPVISDDGRYMAFQLAIATEQAGVGHGIFVYDLDGRK
jgi:hypothetical protein